MRRNAFIKYDGLQVVINYAILIITLPCLTSYPSQTYSKTNRTWPCEMVLDSLHL